MLPPAPEPVIFRGGTRDLRPATTNDNGRATCAPPHRAPLIPVLRPVGHICDQDRILGTARPGDNPSTPWWKNPYAVDRGGRVGALGERGAVEGQVPERAHTNRAAGAPRQRGERSDPPW